MSAGWPTLLGDGETDGAYSLRVSQVKPCRWLTEGLYYFINRLDPPYERVARGSRSLASSTRLSALSTVWDFETGCLILSQLSSGALSLPSPQLVGWEASWFVGLTAPPRLACADDRPSQYFAQTSLIYPASIPSGSRTEVATPAEHGIPFEDVSLTTPDGVRIKAYLMLQQGGRAQERPTVILLHANAGAWMRSSRRAGPLTCRPNRQRRTSSTDS